MFLGRRRGRRIAFGISLLLSRTSDDHIDSMLNKRQMPRIRTGYFGAPPWIASHCTDPRNTAPPPKLSQNSQHVWQQRLDIDRSVWWWSGQNPIKKRILFKKTTMQIWERYEVSGMQKVSHITRNFPTLLPDPGRPVPNSFSIPSTWGSSTVSLFLHNNVSRPNSWTRHEFILHRPRDRSIPSIVHWP